MNRSPEITDPVLALSDLFSFWPSTVGVFLRHRMLCVGRPIVPFHTIADACIEYRLDEPSFQF